MVDGYPADWDTRRKEVYKRDDYECQNCGDRGGPKGNVELHAHHVVPKSSGGTHKLSNLKTVCRSCHRAIHGTIDGPTDTGNALTTGPLDLSEATLEKHAELSMIKGGSGSDDPRDEQYTTASLPAFMYASEIYYPAFSDVTDFALEEEPLPDELYERYSYSRTICRGLLGQEVVSDYGTLFDELFDVVRLTHQPSSMIKDTYTTLDGLTTIHEMTTRWQDDIDPNSPAAYHDFIESTEKFCIVLEKKFEIYDDLVSVDEQGTATLAFSVESEWKRKEIRQEMAQIAREWYESLVPPINDIERNLFQ